MDLQRVHSLIQKFTAGEATAAEQQELADWYREQAYQDAVFPGEEAQVSSELLQRINRATGQQPRRVTLRKWSAAAAVAALIIGAIGIYNLRHTTSSRLYTHTATSIKPGSNLAILTLSNGRQIVLSDTTKGNIATQGNVHITRVANGQLVYQIDDAGLSSGGDAENEIAYNTISTPAGGQYKIVLPDQTTVWLNSMSRLRFPVTFHNAKERRVELSGEGYFEVTHNAAAPFKVVTGAFITEDLGTIFDIKAYGDDPGFSTTLVQGAAQVNAGGTPTLLKPGQQAQYRGCISITDVNVDAVTAWKDGYFRFDDASLEEIMKTVARWYNVTYTFEDESLRKETYGAATTRFSNIATLLELMEKAGTASFKLDGNNIIISKKKS